MTVALDKQSHIYYVDGQPVPLSVTRVLELSGIIPPYPPAAMPFVERAGDLGGAVHEWCEYLDTHLYNEPDFDGLEGSDLVPYVMAYQKFRTKYQPEWMHIEESMVREDVGGVPDRIGFLNDDIYAIVDIKTSRDAKPWWGLQLSGYRWLLGERCSARLQVLHLGRDANYCLYEYPDDISTWESAVEIARWKIRNTW